MAKEDKSKSAEKRRDRHRRPIELTPEEFWQKWRPKVVTPMIRADFMVDLERLMLTRMRDLGLLDDQG